MLFYTTEPAGFCAISALEDGRDWRVDGIRKAGNIIGPKDGSFYLVEREYGVHRYGDPELAAWLLAQRRSR